MTIRTSTTPQDNWRKHLKSGAACALFLGSGILFSGAAAADIYRWVDEDGVPHFGEQPPKGVKSELVKRHVKSSAQNTSQDSIDTNKTDSSFDKPEAAQERAKPKLTAEQKQRKEQQCKAERERLAALQKPGRIRMNLEDGSFKYLSQEEIAAEIETTKLVLSQTCDE